MSVNPPLRLHRLPIRIQLDFLIVGRASEPDGFTAGAVGGSVGRHCGRDGGQRCQQESK